MCSDFIKILFTVFVNTWLGSIEYASLFSLGRRKHRIHRHGTILRSVVMYLCVKKYDVIYLI